MTRAPDCQGRRARRPARLSTAFAAAAKDRGLPELNRKGIDILCDAAYVYAS